ncbi:hypothetical protein [Pseudomonas putida]|uniref:hypothetical protein n=1 Tax=Pseudomonas putida TaxID=303 RepID=UPI000F3B7599|nr:hypothetical protein [Pseudomonas putida]RNF73176.1 hypothetical protein EFJ98_07500 [Pseudomonas putida]
MKCKPPILYPDHPMYTDAVQAWKRHHEAKASGAPAEEVERLRLIAESQNQAVTDYQLKALGGPAGRVH